MSKITLADLDAAAERFKNWGRWGAEDQVGTLNFTQPDDIVAAAGLVKSGKVISLALNYDSNGPQGAKGGFASARFNPIHLMLKTGVDAFAGVLDGRKVRAADDIIIMPLQCGTQWDALSHVFYKNYMWNGNDCRLVGSSGASKAGIEHTKGKMVGRGVLLDIARVEGLETLPDGFSIEAEHLDKAAKMHGVEIRRGDYLIVRTGQMESKLKAGNWDGYSGGDAPGLSFDTLQWVYDKQIAAVATDTWGVEVRPNNSDDAVQPFHWIAIPMMGLTLGEMFLLRDLADDCASDGRYEFLFVGPALPFSGAVGSPTNPLAIK
ncbi:cyclase family protein [Ferrovibrio sp.]|uniref:cyclase family protein n=1 Tax=Ferrovibrio sp. TaxID=1917215 RepID=UPI0035B3E8B7